MTDFNLDDFAFADSYVHVVKNPKTGADTNLQITLAGPGHPQTLAADEAERARIYDKMEKRQAEAEAASKVGRTLPPERETVAESLERNARALAARIVTSTPMIVGGASVTLTPATAEAILANPKFSWLFDSITAAYNNKVNFINVSAQT